MKSGLSNPETKYSKASKESVDMCSHVVSFDRDDGLSLLNIDFPIDMSFG